eukprot:CAMPEP_0201564616 /NCGR_PEP_ID=MMETSP0190_2-20130828/3066_1 /ASSEMBLY_ACC=CAM_ASM_000263 /TAXON_ID=37353 /ORGANISM="Rosalina sp." /LENGTH=288 /DNA_ID=CAMNT_0047981025 /DNA_START=28 /DNA_END=894 /DNA_ORIENTATION=+
MATEPNMNKQPLRLSEFEALMVGAIGGTIETTIQMPLITWKICVQEGRAYPASLREWYRGVFINASSLSPITAVQCYANQLLQTALLTTLNKGNKLSEIEQLSCSAGAGAISALIYGPVDLMVIQQQKYVASLSSTFNIIREKYGAMRVYRGLLSCMVRESVYTMGYLGVAPVIHDRMVNSQSESGDYFRENKMTTSILSAIMGGSFAAILTHPVDTAKTCVQSDLEGSKYTNARWTAKHLYETGGLPVLFKGVIPRTLRLCGACFVIQNVRTGMLNFKRWRLGIDDD